MSERPRAITIEITIATGYGTTEAQLDLMHSESRDSALLADVIAICSAALDDLSKALARRMLIAQHAHCEPDRVLYTVQQLDPTAPAEAPAPTRAPHHPTVIKRHRRGGNA